MRMPTGPRAAICATCVLVSILARAADTTALEATLDPSEMFRPGVSLIWSPTGQASWDALLEYHQVRKIDMHPRSITAEKMNDFKWEKAPVLPAGTVIYSGDDNEAFREKIRVDLRSRVGLGAAAMIGPYKPPGTLLRDGTVILLKSAIMVSAISCKPRFPVDFVPDARPKLFTNSAGRQFKALGFGVTGQTDSKYDTAVRVLDDDLAGNFSLRLAFFTNDDQKRECLVISTALGHQNLTDLLMQVRGLLQKERVPEKIVEIRGKKWRYADILAAGDILWMPNIKAFHYCEYMDLIGKRYLEDPKTESWWEIAEAAQLLNISFDHKGVMVQSVFKVAPNFLTATGGGVGGSKVQTDAPLPLYPKTFIFDKPFVASLWREGAAWPYLACYVDGPEMLTSPK